MILSPAALGARRWALLSAGVSAELAGRDVSAETAMPSARLSFCCTLSLHHC